MRLFVGIELGPALLTSLADDITRLREAVERAAPRLAVRWVPAANLHLTLVFIGDIEDARVPALIGSLEPPIAVAPFELDVTGAGTFPTSGPLRVIWLGVGAAAVATTVVCDDVVRRLAPFGCEREARGYTPHLTVARVKDARGPDARHARDAVRTTPVKGGLTLIEAVTLFRSRASSRGSTYERLLRVPLQG